MADSFNYDVFLSHNRQDKPRVRALAERLKEAGLRVWLDDWVIKPGDDIYLAIERGLEAARGAGALPLACGAGLGLGGAGEEHGYLPRYCQCWPAAGPTMRLYSQRLPPMLAIFLFL